MNKDIELLWQRIYSIVEGRGKVATFGSYISLPEGFDTELLNQVAKLKIADQGQLSAQIPEVRGQINVANAMGLIGNRDHEELQEILDKIEQGN